MKRDNEAQLTIIIACRNEIGHIRSFLDSILAQDLSGYEWEAIVADGMSEDGTRAVLEEYCRRYPRLRIIDNPRRFVSTGLNAAIEAARGEIILRMDAHTSYAPDYTRLCVETLERTGADNVGGPARTRAAGLWPEAIAAAYHSPFSTGGARFHDVNYEGWTDTVPYGCWRKETFERIGLFDETLIRNQDDELNLRLLRAGGTIWQSPRIVSWYSPRPSLTNLFRQYFQYGFWKVAVIRKHRLPASWRHAVPAGFVVLNLALLLGCLVSAVQGTPVWLARASAAWVALTASYLLASLTCSFVVAKRHGWRIFIYLPVVFATYHVSWGLGFFSGIVTLLRHRSGAFVNAADATAYTRISR